MFVKYRVCVPSKTTVLQQVVFSVPLVHIPLNSKDTYKLVLLEVRVRSYTIGIATVFKLITLP